MLNQEQISLCAIVSQIAERRGERVFAVGGVVRDLLLGLTQVDYDLDLVVEGDSLACAQAVHDEIGGELRTFPDFRTAKILQPQKFPQIHEVDFAASRSEVYRSPGALPEVTPAPLEADLARRDFTINAMALPLAALASASDFSGAVIDTFGGREDLAAKQIRVLHPRSFVDDPTRLFRAVRYAGRLGGLLEKGTAILFQEALDANCLQSISINRRVNETVKMFRERDPSPVLALAAQYGLASKVVDPTGASDGMLAQALSKLAVQLPRVPIERSLIEDALYSLILAVQPESARVPLAVILGLAKRKRNIFLAEIELIAAGAWHELSEAGIRAAAALGMQGALEQAKKSGILINGV